MLSADQKPVWERVCAHIDRRVLQDTVVQLVNIPSPTGEEGPLARAVVERLRKNGIDASEQVIDPLQSNAFARLPGAGGGTSLMLYAPTDTVTSNNEEEDLPWAAETMLPELRAAARVIDGHVAGLGAQNPKGHAACVMVAMEAIAKSGVSLNGDLLLGLGAGGMPTNARPKMREGSGHGVGCDWMLRHAQKPDYAIIAKSGWSISWEEVGFAWYEVRVKGTHTYVGSRHLMPYANVIERAGQVVVDLEKWFPVWSAKHKSGLVEPQGVVSHIEGGWKRMPAFTPAECRFLFDLRLSPRMMVEEADADVEKVLSEISRARSIPLSWSRLMMIPGTSTSPDSRIIRSSIGAWELVEGREHKPATSMSGGTDANILRAHGVPTARIGLPKNDMAQGDFQRGMNIVKIDDMMRLTKALAAVAIAICAE